MRVSRRTWIAAWAGALGACLAAPARAEEVVAVLSARSGPYLEAYQAFEESFGRVDALTASQGETALDEGVRVVVTFGGRAAQQRYPADVAVIRCLAPGVGTSAPAEGTILRVPMQPPAESLLSGIKALQPRAKRLAAFWASEGFADYARELRRAAAQAGLELEIDRLSGPNALPDRLRGLKGKVDALWLAPDPALVNPESFGVLREFAWANHVPFYAPTAGLAEEGAAASISASFRSIGRAAAKAARSALRGDAAGASLYPELDEIVVNQSSARRSGLEVPAEALRRASKVLP